MNTIKDKINGFQLTAMHFINELKAIFADSGALLILVGAIIIYPIIYSIGYYNEVMTDINVAVVDLDQSAASRKYAAMIDATREVNVSHDALDMHSAENLLLNNKVSGIVLIPDGFEKDVLSGQQANVAVYADASYFLKYKNIISATTYSNAYFSGGVSIMRYMAEGQSVKQAKISNDPLPVYTHILYNPSSGYASFIMPGIILVIFQQTLLIGIGILGGSFSESKAPSFILPAQRRKREILPLLTGKTGAYLFISLFNIAYAAILVHHWFHYPDKANMLDVLMLLFPYLLSVIFLGIGISTLFKHRESSIVFMVFLSPIVLFLSGLSWPTSSMPDWLVFISKIVPSTTAIPAYLRLRTMGVSITEIKSEMLFLYGQAAVYFILTLIYFYVRVAAGNRKKTIQEASQNTTK